MNDDRNKNNASEDAMDINTARTRYAELRTQATSYEGWTNERFDARCKAIASYFMGKGESKGQAWVSAATEVLNEEIQEAYAA